MFKDSIRINGEVALPRRTEQNSTVFVDVLPSSHIWFETAEDTAHVYELQAMKIDHAGKVVSYQGCYSQDGVEYQRKFEPARIIWVGKGE